MIETPNNFIEKLTEVSKLPETIQKMVIKSFRSLFENPEFVKKIQGKIANIPEYVERMQLTGTLNRITWLQSDTKKLTEVTGAKLAMLRDNIGPIKNNRNTTTA